MRPTGGFMGQTFLGISGFPAGGTVQDISDALLGLDGFSEPVLSPFSNITVSTDSSPTGSASTAPLVATVTFSGNGGAAPNEPAGLIQVVGGASGRPPISIWDTAAVSPTQLQAILRGVQVELGGVGSGRAQEGYGNNESITVTVSDTVNVDQRSYTMAYQEVDPNDPTVGAGETVSGGTV